MPPTPTNTQTASTSAAASQSPPTTRVEPIPLGKGTSRVSGKFWKEKRGPTKRSHLSPAVKSKSFAQRKELQTKEMAVRQYIKDLKQEKEAKDAARKQAITDRKKAHAEEERLEAMKAKMGARRLDRLRRRQGRSKKINQ
ncbi:hypothetical protein FRB94_010622 [Tulasnella sp. JGI-2019a]|nr:hypothetical protein FRB94_010622 [Tulasnella sp. JGI-2019a]KAG9017829.1 hypothetical protein FRB93_004640 [Tulasnella sp. JGI-2019a]KAG9035452.1 hypothetical protein FRB95_011317 [Tulasnella sp. JGI-2019a]